jgi:rubrerythrin
MSSDLTRCVEILEKAIAFEDEGIRFFTEKSETAISDVEKNIFTSLAKDEKGHRRYLVQLRDDLIKANNLDPLENAEHHDDVQPRKIFETALEEVQDPYEYAPEDLEILDGAMEVERKGYAMYSAAAAEMTSPRAKALFEHLAAEEQVHYELLSNTRAFIADPEGFNGYSEGSMLDGG